MELLTGKIVMGVRVGEGRGVAGEKSVENISIVSSAFLGVWV